MEMNPRFRNGASSWPKEARAPDPKAIQANYPTKSARPNTGRQPRPRHTNVRAQGSAIRCGPRNDFYEILQPQAQRRPHGCLLAWKSREQHKKIESANKSDRPPYHRPLPTHVTRSGYYVTSPPHCRPVDSSSTNQARTPRCVTWAGHVLGHYFCEHGKVSRGQPERNPGLLNALT